MDDLTVPPSRFDRAQGTGTIGAGPELSRQSRRVLTDIEEYWHDLSRAQRIPFRSEVDPGRIDVALPHAFILNRVAKGTGRIRVAGSRIETILGLDPRGMPLTTFFTPNGRTVLQHWFSKVFERPAILELPLVSSRGLGRSKVTGAMILLPLAAEDGSISLAMGALVTDGDVGRSPRRFDVPDGKIRVSPVRLMNQPAPTRPAPQSSITPSMTPTTSRAPTPPRAPVAPRAQEIVERRRPLVSVTADREPVQPSSAAGVPYLRLVVDNT